ASSLPPQKRTSARLAGSSAVRLHHFRKNTKEDHGKSWHECDLWAAPINVRSWESNGLNADVAFGPYGQFCCDAHNVTFLPTTMWQGAILGQRGANETAAAALPVSHLSNFQWAASGSRC